MTPRSVRYPIRFAIAAVVTIFVFCRTYHRFFDVRNDIYSYVPARQQGLALIDITVVTCSTINVFSSCDSPSTEWYRIDKELYLGRAWFSRAYIFVKFKDTTELATEDSVVVDVSVSLAALSINNRSSDVAWWEPRPGGVWIKLSKRHQLGNRLEAVTGIDLLFGDDAVEARLGWHLIDCPLLLTSGSSMLSVYVSVHRGRTQTPKKPTPRVSDQGRFKIMQIADMHLSNGLGQCREAIPNAYHNRKCEADPRTIEFIHKLLDQEKPNLVVLSGDQVNGETAPDAATAILKYAALLADHKIPHVGIFGNHDDEKTMPRAQQMALMEALPYSLSRAGPADVDGVGNYYVDILAPGDSADSAMTIYLFDTHSNSPNEKEYPGYDWIKPSQIKWFKKTAASLKSNHANSSYGHIDMAFIHIPMTEYANPKSPRIGRWREGVTAPVFNSGLRDALMDEGVVLVSAGHDHCNDYCSLSSKEASDPKNESHTPSLWMCYAGGSGFGGYGGYGEYVRRVRFFEIEINFGRVVTWKRLEYGNTDARIDLQTVVDGGRPVSTSTLGSMGQQEFPPAPPAPIPAHGGHGINRGVEP